MRRSVIAATAAAALAIGGGYAVAGTADGQGAQKSGLDPITNGSMGGCDPSSGSGTNGFAILNTVGQVGAARFTNGEVSLKGGTPHTTYDVYIDTNGNCVMATQLTTNAAGNGNAHLQTTPSTADANYVVLQLDGTEVYASAPVPLQ